MALLYIFTVAQAVALLFAVVRIGSLTLAVRHHEHVMRLTLVTLSKPGPHQDVAHDFSLMVLDEEAWDRRDRLPGRRATKGGGT